MKDRIDSPEQIKLKGKTIIANRRKFPVHFAYSKLGQKNILFSNNMKSVNFMSNGVNSLANQLEYAYLNNISKLMDNSFSNAIQLTSLSMNPELEEIGNNCFDGCQNLVSVEIPNNVKTISDNAFSNCRALTNVNFEHYEYDSFSNTSPSLTNVGEKFLENSSNAKILTIPESVTSLTAFEQNALEKSNANTIYFLGLNSTEAKKLATTNCLGLNKDCYIITKDNKRLKFLSKTKTIENETFNQYEKAKIVTNGKPNKLLLGRKLYAFSEELYNWCIDPAQHDSKKFPNARTCPLIIMFVDFKTSATSRKFLTDILASQQFYTWIKENLKCYLFVLDRNGHITTGADANLQFFRSMPQFGNGDDKDFVHLSFIYDGNFNQTTFMPGSLSDLKDLINEYSDMTKFGDFDYTGYESVLDEPDPETIPTSGSDESVIKNFHGSYPDWCSGNSIGSSTAWNIASEAMDFDLISTPETTFVLAGQYDENNPENGPSNTVKSFVNCFDKFADTVVALHNSDCHSKYKSEFLKGKNYRYFIFFEFSHGNTKVITIGIGYSEIWNMFSNMSSHQRVYGIFDSCHSGSMLQSGTSSTQESDINTNIISYLKYKFERRDVLLNALFGDASAARSVKPKMILHSPTSAENYSYYYIGNTSCFMQSYEPIYNKNKNVRFNEFWNLIKSGCQVLDSRGDAIPQQMVYPNESTSYYKNKIYF